MYLIRPYRTITRAKSYNPTRRVKPQDDLYNISWEVGFDNELFETRKDKWPDTATRLPNDAATGGVDVTEDERCSAKEDEQRSGEQTNESDVNGNEIRSGLATSRDVTFPPNESGNEQCSRK